MVNPINLNTEAYWSRYPTSIFVDLHIFSLLLSLFGILFFLHEKLAVWSVVLCGSVLLAVYLANSIKVIRRTERIDGSVLSDRQLNIRVGKGLAPQLRSVFFRPTIIFPSEGAIEPHWLAHEIGHIRSRDHFMYAFAKPALLMFFVIFVGSLFYMLIATDWQWHLFGTEIPYAVLYMVAFMVFSFLLIGCTALTILLYAPREREYLADRFAHDVCGDALTEALQKSANWEACFVDKSLLVKISNLFTHPSASKRLKRLLRPKFPLMELSFVSGLLFGSTALFFDFMHRQAGRFFENTSPPVFTFDHPYYPGVLLYTVGGFVVPFTAMVYQSSLAAFSVERHGLRGVASLGAMFLLGAATFRLVATFPRFDVLDPTFWSLWLMSFADVLIGDILLLFFFVALWAVNKRAKGRVDSFSLYTHLSATVFALVVFSVTGLLNL